MARARPQSGRACDPVADRLAIAAAENDPVAPQKRQMLRDSQLAEPQIPSQLTYRFLALDQVAGNQKPVPVVRRPQERAGLLGGGEQGLRVQGHRGMRLTLSI